MTKIPVGKYKDLKAGETYTYRTIGKTGASYRQGKLISVTITWREEKDEQGKITSKTLTGDWLVFEPLGDAAFYEWKSEKLKVYFTTIGLGLFEIFRD